MVGEAAVVWPQVEVDRVYSPFALFHFQIDDFAQVIGSLVALLVLIGVGVGVGVAVAKSKSNSNKSTSTTSSTGAVTETDPNDPSTFQKDTKLKHSFYGLAYTPEGSQLPSCGNSLGMRLSILGCLVALTRLCDVPQTPSLRIFSLCPSSLRYVLNSNRAHQAGGHRYVASFPY